MSTNIIKGKKIVLTARDGTLNDVELTSGQNEALIINNVKTIGAFADTITVNGSMVVSGSVSGGAAGNNTEIQFNQSGSLGASSDLTFDTNTLSVNNTIESPSDLNLNSGEATTTTGNGFDVNITGGAGGSTNGDGGSLNLVCGTTFGGNSQGGSIALTAGDSQGSSDGGSITITGGDSLSGSGSGGNITLTPGTNSGGSGSDGTVIISSNMIVDNTITGASSLNLNSAAASNINLTAGAGIVMSTGANSGITMTTGSGSGGNGGDFIFIGGTGGTTGSGSDISLNAGTGGSTSGRGGTVGISGGNASAGNSDGGSITLTPGTATGSGTKGAVIIPTGFNLTLTDDPVAGTDAVNKDYVDALHPSQAYVILQNSTTVFTTGTSTTLVIFTDVATETNTSVMSLNSSRYIYINEGGYYLFTFDFTEMNNPVSVLCWIGGSNGSDPTSSSTRYGQINIAGSSFVSNSVLIRCVADDRFGLFIFNGAVTGIGGVTTRRPTFKAFRMAPL